MATRASIKADLDKARKQADKLDGVADDISKLKSNKFQNTINDVANAWRGDNATRYVGKCNELQNELDKTVKDLRKAASTIRQIAQNIYNAELRNIELAERREYKKG